MLKSTGTKSLCPFCVLKQRYHRAGRHSFHSLGGTLQWSEYSVDRSELNQPTSVVGLVAASFSFTSKLIPATPL